jgi:phenylacetate-coenzyme A ligase PaaK-like adenylate-forming protein
MTDLVSDDLDVGAQIRQGRVEVVSTSGTSEERLSAYSDNDVARVPPAFDEVWGLPEDVSPRTAVFTSAVCSGGSCSAQPRPLAERIRHGTTLLLESPLDLFTLSEAQVRRVALEMTEFNADFLLANPIYLHWLIRRATEFNVELPRPRVILTSYQYLSGCQRRAIERSWQVPVYSMYSLTELGGYQVGIECRRGRMHVREDHCAIEIIAPSDVSAPAGVGAVVVSTIASRLSPLVRYVTGDIGEIVEEQCDCPLDDWQQLRMHGRARDMLFLGGRWRTSRQIDEALVAVEHLDFYTVIQTAADALEVQVIPALDGCPGSVEIRERLSDAFSLRQVNVTEVRRLKAEPSLKYRMTCCDWKEAPGWP